MKGWFVSGTDTDCGKTLISAALVQKLVAGGERVAVMKPVAAGCTDTSEGLRNQDAQQLIAAAGGGLSYETVNPYAFEPPIAPHVAAAQVDVDIGWAPIREAFDRLCAGSEVILVEGAGGWRVPLGEGLDMAGLAGRLQLPVILVVGMRLGCLNHALLSAEAIERDGCRLAGWVANRIDPVMACPEENLQALRERIAAPCLGVVPFLQDAQPAAVAEHLDLPAG